MVLKVGVFHSRNNSVKVYVKKCGLHSPRGFSLIDIHYSVTLFQGYIQSLGILHNYAMVSVFYNKMQHICFQKTSPLRSYWKLTK